MYISQFNQIKLTNHKMSCDAHLFKQYQHFNSQNYIAVTPYRHSVWIVLNLWPLPKDTLCQVWLQIGYTWKETNWYLLSIEIRGYKQIDEKTINIIALCPYCLYVFWNYVNHKKLIANKMVLCRQKSN